MLCVVEFVVVVGKRNFGGFRMDSNFGGEVCMLREKGECFVGGCSGRVVLVGVRVLGGLVGCLG